MDVDVVFVFMLLIVVDVIEASVFVVVCVVVAAVVIVTDVVIAAVMVVVDDVFCIFASMAVIVLEDVVDDVFWELERGSCVAVVVCSDGKISSFFILSSSFLG